MEKKTKNPKMLATRRSCVVTGTGLSHFILMRKDRK